MASASLLTVLGCPLALREGETGHAVFGAADLWVRRAAGAWHIAYRLGAEEDRKAMWDQEPAPEEVPWERWITRASGGAPVLRVRLPERPVVIRPETTVRLPPRETVEFFVGLPLRLALELEGETLGCYASIQLSSTWFGTPEEGELCYAMRTLAHGDPTALAPRMHRCICPLQVRNNAKEVLAFERVCVQCSHLGLYLGGARFWSNAVRLSYRGRREWSRLVYARSAPAQVEGAVLASPPQSLGAGAFRLKAGRLVGAVTGSA